MPQDICVRLLFGYIRAVSDSGLASVPTWQATLGPRLTPAIFESG